MRGRARIRRIGVQDLHALPTTCPTCPLGAARYVGLESENGAATWARAAESDWGFCGIAMFHVEHIVGYLLLTSPLHVPRAGPQSGYGLNPDAAVVMSLRVVPEYVGQGVGRQLVQAAAARIARTPFRALEVQSTHTLPSCAVPPAGFLEATGFQLIDSNPLHPRYRLDLSRTVTWTPVMMPTVQQLLGLVRPLRPLPPEPAGRAHREPHRSLGSRS
ncbi:GNAT family N-acetyltransferase [Ammonicoccus fulvus]|uniref:GNAT family N-acetyltransferase n=1 Tax=Ammonicoccus fulvus TaxID=3138240 RepID=A0ABZ3FTB1_9ACTN